MSAVYVALAATNNNTKYWEGALESAGAALRFFPAWHRALYRFGKALDLVPHQRRDARRFLRRAAFLSPDGAATLKELEENNFGPDFSVSRTRNPDFFKYSDLVEAKNFAAAAAWSIRPLVLDKPTYFSRANDLIFSDPRRGAHLQAQAQVILQNKTWQPDKHISPVRLPLPSARAAADFQERIN